MSDLFFKAVLPQCCLDCQHKDSEWDEYKYETLYFCDLNVFFPTKKRTCKKQKPYSKQSAEAAHE